MASIERLEGVHVGKPKGGGRLAWHQGRSRRRFALGEQSSGRPAARSVEVTLHESITKPRLASFADGVFAVIITIMVLQLRMPAQPSFHALVEAWPTAVSYAVSYVLIVIMWINHHFLWGFVEHSTPRLILWNFVHMFAASLVPFSTAWVAETRMASVPVFVYAATIVMVNLAYHGFASAVLPVAAAPTHRPWHIRRTALLRSTLTLAMFVVAMVLSLRLPHVAFLVVTCVLLTYVRPEVPVVQRRSGQRVSDAQKASRSRF
jgi:uncharacterized membrane protein